MSSPPFRPCLPEEPAPCESAPATSTGALHMPPMPPLRLMFPTAPPEFARSPSCEPGITQTNPGSQGHQGCAPAPFVLAPTVQAPAPPTVPPLQPTHFPQWMTSPPTPVYARPLDMLAALCEVQRNMSATNTLSPMCMPQFAPLSDDVAFPLLPFSGGALAAQQSQQPAASHAFLDLVQHEYQAKMRVAAVLSRELSPLRPPAVHTFLPYSRNTSGESTTIDRPPSPAPLHAVLDPLVRRSTRLRRKLICCSTCTVRSMQKYSENIISHHSASPEELEGTSACAVYVSRCCFAD